MKIKSGSGLFRNYVISWWRSLARSKVTSFISIAGLAFGLTASFFTGLYVLDEWSYDQHFPNHGLIYRVTSTHAKDGLLYRSALTRAGVGPALVNELAEVRAATRLLPADEGFFYNDDDVFKEKIVYTDASFLTVFGIELLKGNATDCLSQPSSLIISEQTAARLFGPRWQQEEVTGKSVSVDGRIPLTITGVFRDFPEQTHFSSRLFASIPSGLESWMSDHSDVYTYVLLRAEGDVSQTKEKLLRLSPTLSASRPGDLARLDLQPVTAIYLSPALANENALQGSAANIYILLFAALFLVLITAVNFANLYTAASFNRLREVGIRKSIGAQPGQLRFQFWGETLLLTIVALGLGLSLCMLLLPLFNDLTGKRLLLSALFSPKTLALMVGLSLGLAALAGFYPALYLSGKKTLDALKGVRHTPAGGGEVRKSLIILQFSLSCIMMVLSLVAYRQVHLIATKDLGFDRGNTVAVANPYMLGSTEKIISLRNELQDVAGVEGITITGYTPAQQRWGAEKITFADRDPLSPRRHHARWMMIDENFIPTMGIQLIDGRNFRENHDHDREAVIINARAARLFGLTINGKSAVGAALSCYEKGNEGPMHYTVVGVVADFNFGSLHSEIKPIVMRVGYHRFEMALRLTPEQPHAETIARIESVWRKHLPRVPFEYTFIRDRFDRLHRSDVTAGRLFTLSCLLTIVLSALGLLSLVSWSVASRMKEFGIRKLLGASGVSITWLVAADFMKLMVLSWLLAMPFAWVAAQRWLDRFAFKTAIPWWIPVLSGIILVVVCVLTLSWQAAKASATNPIDNLRQE